jgi:hypothetical protein
MTRGWMSRDVLGWERRVESEDVYDVSDSKRAYQHLAHAQRLLRMSDREPLHRVEVITTLKRCVNTRLKHLDRLYSFSKAPVKGNPRHLIERLSVLGLVRPLLIRDLIAIRNAVEHQDAPPSSQNRCAEFIDVVWYFLRSTDPLTARRPDGFYLEAPRGLDDSWVELNLGAGDRPWAVAARGKLPVGMISPEEVDAWPVLEFIEFPAYIRLQGLPLVPPSDDGYPPPFEICGERAVFFAEVVGPPDVFVEVVERWFGSW